MCKVKKQDVWVGDLSSSEVNPDKRIAAQKADPSLEK